MINLKLFLYITIPIFFSCSLNSEIDTTSQDNELMKKLDKGITLFESKKYTRSLDEFNSIILNDRFKVSSRSSILSRRV